MYLFYDFFQSNLTKCIFVLKIFIKKKKNNISKYKNYFKFDILGIQGSWNIMVD